MLAFIYVITTLVSALLSILQLLMLLRAVLSWFPVDDSMGLAGFVFAMTEPVVYPLRVLLSRFDFVSSVPIDIPFFAAIIILSFVQAMLPAVG